MSVLGTETLEAGYGHQLNSAVELFLGVLILVLGSGDSNSDLSMNVSATSFPEMSVETWVNSNVLCVHFLGGELLDFSNSFGSSLLERDTLKSFMHVQSVISSHILHLLSLSVGGTNHSNKSIK